MPAGNCRLNKQQTDARTPEAQRQRILARHQEQSSVALTNCSGSSYPRITCSLVEAAWLTSSSSSTTCCRGAMTQRLIACEWCTGGGPAAAAICTVHADPADCRAAAASGAPLLRRSLSARPPNDCHKGELQPSPETTFLSSISFDVKITTCNSVLPGQGQSAVLRPRLIFWAQVEICLATVMPLFSGHTLVLHTLQSP